MRRTWRQVLDIIKTKKNDVSMPSIDTTPPLFVIDQMIMIWLDGRNKKLIMAIDHLFHFSSFKVTK